jgi:RNA polymerase sigma-70 factor, ECF subfamily
MRCTPDSFVPGCFSVADESGIRDNRRSHLQRGTITSAVPLMATDKQIGASPPMDFESLVEQYYRGLYQFAYNLARDEAEACDLTQQTFLIWARKGHQLRDPLKVKTWLFTTLHREFLQARRKHQRFPHYELDEVAGELPSVAPTMVDQLDAATVVTSLAQVNELYRAPLTLFYLEDYSYKEIAEILDVPIGTVQSRIARGKAQLYKTLADDQSSPATGVKKSRE